MVYAVINGYFDSVPVKQVKEYEKRLCEKLEHEYSSLLNRLEGGSYEKEDIEEMKKAISEITR